MKGKTKNKILWAITFASIAISCLSALMYAFNNQHWVYIVLWVISFGEVALFTYVNREVLR